MGACEHAAMLGTRILDLSESITGAYAGRLLASLGASVAVGEPAGGSPLRQTPPMIDTAAGRRSATWEYLSSMKDSLVIDFDDGDGDGHGSVLDAAGRFDLVLLATDGPAAPLAMLATRLRAAHPGLAVVVVTPFGLTGPYSEWRAGPLELWAVGGHLTLTGSPDRHPLPGGGPWNSYLVGATAAVAAQAALFEQRQGPNGHDGAAVLVDVGAMQTLAGSHQWTITAYTHNGYVKRRAGNRLGEAHHPICLYECLDGWVCIAAATMHQWEGLCIGMDRVELLADDSLAGAAARFDRADEIDEIITAWTKERTTAEVVEICQRNFCPAGRVNDLTDLLVSEQLAFRRFWGAAPHLGPGVVMPGVPFRLPSTPLFRAAPALGSSSLPEADTTSVAAEARPRTGPSFAPLAGVRVLELTISWAGPLAGRWMADLGADVIKIEHPTSRGIAVIAPDPDADPDPWTWGELPPPSVRNGIFPNAEPGVDWWNRMGLWNKMNRSKRSLCLDLKGPGGREVFEQLVGSADIVLNNYSPRGVRSLGIHHDTLRAIKPTIVTVAMSGFGATGPAAEAVSWGPILDAASGLAATTGYADSGPYKQGVAYPDPVGGTHGAAALLAAWWEHRRTGEAVHVDLSQLETLLAVAGDQVIETAVRGEAPERRGARSATYAPAGVYPCAPDGVDRWMALTVYDDADWLRLRRIVPGLDNSGWESVEARHRDHDEIDAVIGRWTSIRSPQQAMGELQAAGVAAVMASTNRDLVEDPHLAARGFLIEVKHASYGPTVFPGSLLLVDGKPLPVRPVSSLGADNQAVLDGLGVPAARQNELFAAGTIATAPPS